MQIIIVGCGKVGRSLAEQLQEEETDLTLIDILPQRLNALSDDLDALCIEGNGASIEVLREAGVEQADILIAVTGSDELNLLCCLIAQRTGHCNTIARVRNPIYSQEIGFIKERLGVSMIINPEHAAASEISKLLRFPSAIKIDTFSGGRVELLKFQARPEFGLNNLKVLELKDRFQNDILVCGIESKGNIIIPGGNDAIHDGDLVSILATPAEAASFFKKSGLQTNAVKNAIIVGGGTISNYLTRSLLDSRIDVKLIEKDLAKCEALSELYPEATVINGDGTDRELLMEENLQNAESFVCLTNMDEENIFLGMYAKKRTRAKVIAKVNKLDFDEVIDSLDIGSVIYPKYITADRIVQYVRAMQNTIGSKVETLFHIMDNKAEALEFKIREQSPVVGKPLAELSLKPNLLVGSLTRAGAVRIPRGQDTIEIDDRVIIVTTQRGLSDITDILDK